MTLTEGLPDVERIARSIPARYLERELAAGHARGSAPSLVGWDELPEDYRDASRAQAEDIPAKLANIGVHAEPASAGAASGFAFTAPELDLLARREHQRWMDHKLSAGWTVGPRDEARKHHPCLVPYEQLSEAERQKDADVVLQIPDLPRLAGYQVVRDDGRAGSRATATD